MAPAELARGGLLPAPSGFGRPTPPSGLRAAGPTPFREPFGVPFREPELPCTTECGLRAAAELPKPAPAPLVKFEADERLEPPEVDVRPEPLVLRLDRVGAATLAAPPFGAAKELLPKAPPLLTFAPPPVGGRPLPLIDPLEPLMEPPGFEP